MTNEPTTTRLPLSRLIASKDNVRRTAKDEGIAELAASIAAHGLRQNLNVRPTADGKRYEVVAGGRRLKALKRLVKEGRLAKDVPIDCRVLADDDDATEISLVENALRLAMHPDDQFEAFRELIETKGMSSEDVAARFGVSPALVERRLRLARVSPRLRALYRKGDLSLDQLMAFTLRDDHDEQERVWKALPDWSRHPRDIRAAMTLEAVATTDRLARFVGIEAYKAEGGTVLRDLFDAEDGGYLEDRPLLLRLAGEKLAHLTRQVQAEGWKWVRAELEPDYSLSYGRVRPLPADDDDDAERFAPEDLAKAGTLIRLGHDGEARFDRGLVHPDDIERAPREAAEPKDKGELPGTMVEELTAHRTAALRVELARNPVVALAVAVQTLALPLFYDDFFVGCLALRMTSEPLERHAAAPGDCPAHAAFEAERERWAAQLPEAADGLLDWCLAQTPEMLLALLAFCSASSLNAVKERHERQDSTRLTHAEAVAKALGLDMAAWWQPSVEGFYGRLPKVTLLRIVSEAKAPMTVSIGAVKKPEAARYVAQAMTGKPWLPAPLRAA